MFRKRKMEEGTKDSPKEDSRLKRTATSTLGNFFEFFFSYWWKMSKGRNKKRSSGFSF
jgi:hypothetical protein